MAYDPDNVFARILAGEIPNRTVYEDEEVLAFHDISPQAPVHVLAIPKAPYADFDEFSRRAGPEAVGRFFAAVGRIAREELGLAEAGYRLIVNCGADGGQEVAHVHVHILGGRALGRMIARAG